MYTSAPNTSAPNTSGPKTRYCLPYISAKHTPPQKGPSPNERYSPPYVSPYKSQYELKQKYHTNEDGLYYSNKRNDMDADMHYARWCFAGADTNNSEPKPSESK